MKDGIHPKYGPIKITCACGNEMTVGSTLGEDLRVEICAQCHPLYTGKAKFIDSTGRMERYETRKKKTLELQSK